MPNPSDDGSPRGDGAGSPALYAAVRPGSGRVQPRALHDGAQQVGPGRPLRLASPWRPPRVLGLRASRLRPVRRRGALSPLHRDTPYS
jgi:hypothetical protein